MALVLLFSFGLLSLSYGENLVGSCNESKNIALGKPTNQSYVNYGSQFKSGVAVDGDRDGQTTVTDSENYVWWQVDLLDIYVIKQAMVTNSKPQKYLRIDVTFEVWNETTWLQHIQTTTSCWYKADGQTPTKLYLCDSSSAVGRYLRVSKYRPSPSFVTFREVEVYGYKLSCDATTVEMTSPVPLSNATCNCTCNARASSTFSNMTTEEFRASIKSLLTIPKKETSLNKRKKISASDERTSSRNIGVVGVVIIVLECSFFVLCDVDRILKLGNCKE